MSRQSVAKAHQKIQELSWEPLYHEPVSQYGTDYTFEKAQKKDPLKQVLRSYFPMQEEKDHRVYGASGRRHPRQHVPPGTGALAGMAEAVPVHHPAARDLRGAGDAAAVPDRA